MPAPARPPGAPPAGPPAEPVLVTRRQLLALTALSAAAGALSTQAGGLAGTAISWYARPVGVGYGFFSNEEAAIVRAFAATAYPSTPTLPFDAARAGIDHYIDEAMAGVEAGVRDAVRTLLHGLDAWPRPRRLYRFSDLDEGQRREVLDHWLHHFSPDIRGVAGLLVLLAGMGYTTHPQNAAFFRQMHGCAYGRGTDA